METTALHPADIEGAWSLRSSIFPRSNTYELLSMSFIPTCRDEDGVITEARYPIPYEYARQPNAKLTIHCPVESPKRITQISLNGQDYVDVIGTIFTYYSSEYLLLKNVLRISLRILNLMWRCLKGLQMLHAINL